jgi:basic membrane protein A
VAAWSSKTKKVGAVGGWEIPPIRRQVEAFRRGAVEADPKVDARTTFVGTFYDPVKGKEAATALIGTGVDVVAHMADATGLGVIEAAREKKVFTIGWTDQLDLAPAVMLTSAVVDSAGMIKQVVERAARGQFEGKLLDFGLESGLLRLGRWGESAPREVRAKAEQLFEDVKTGKVKVPKVDLKALMQKKP